MLTNICMKCSHGWKCIHKNDEKFFAFKSFIIRGGNDDNKRPFMLFIGVFKFLLTFSTSHNTKLLGGLKFVKHQVFKKLYIYITKFPILMELNSTWKNNLKGKFLR